MTDQTGPSNGPTRRALNSPDVPGRATDPPGLAEFKQRSRASWAAGDYASVAQRELWPLGERIVARAGIRPGEDVLDLACGTGNAAIRAAQAGARVVGVDLTPELMAVGARLATEAGVEVEWVEGDMESLPFDSASFDAVVSILGVSSAPRHQVVADELVRVLRPGGRLVLCEWTHDGVMSHIFATVARYLPPAPPFAMPARLWGDEGHVRGLFAGAPIDLEFERGVLELPPFESPEADVEFHATRFGPLVQARLLTEADGRWPSLRADLVPLHAGHTAVDYLVTIGLRH